VLLTSEIDVNTCEIPVFSTYFAGPTHQGTVTDLGGTYRNLGGVFADNNAALLDSVKSTTLADPANPLSSGVLGAMAGYGSTSMA
jgi:hypothetical protein